MYELISTCVFPATPRLVEIKITPLDALEPYIACEEASLRISIEETSFELRSLIWGTIIPSTIYSGDCELLKERLPRTSMSDPPPGAAVFRVTWIPGACPRSISVTFEVGNFSKLSDFTDATEPVKSLFLTTP